MKMVYKFIAYLATTFSSSKVEHHPHFSLIKIYVSAFSTILDGGTRRRNRQWSI